LPVAVVGFGAFAGFDGFVRHVLFQSVPNGSFPLCFLMPETNRLEGFFKSSKIFVTFVLAMSSKYKKQNGDHSKRKLELN